MLGDWPLECLITTRNCFTSSRSPQAALWPLFPYSERAPPHALCRQASFLAFAQSRIAPGLHHLPNRAFLAQRPAESSFPVSWVWDQAQLGSE